MATKAIGSARRWLLFLAMGAVALSVVAGCSGSGSSTDSSTEAATDAGPEAGADADSDAGAPFACAPADLTGVQDVLAVFKSGEPSPAAGGSLAPGRYVLTSITLYFGSAPIPPSTGAKYRTVLEISASEQRSTAEVTDPKGQQSSYTVGSLSVSNTTKTTTFRCASSSAAVGTTAQEPFTATSNKITLYTQATSYTLVEELSRL